MRTVTTTTTKEQLAFLPSLMLICNSFASIPSNLKIWDQKPIRKSLWETGLFFINSYPKRCQFWLNCTRVHAVSVGLKIELEFLVLDIICFKHFKGFDRKKWLKTIWRLHNEFLYSLTNHTNTLAYKNTLIFQVNVSDISRLNLPMNFLWVCMKF